MSDSPPHPDTHPGTGDTSDTGNRADPAGPDAPGRREHGSEEEIDEAGDESFPASDAPQWWSGEPDDHA